MAGEQHHNAIHLIVRNKRNSGSNISIRERQNERFLRKLNDGTKTVNKKNDLVFDEEGISSRKYAKKVSRINRSGIYKPNLKGKAKLISTKGIYYKRYSG